MLPHISAPSQRTQPPSRPAPTQKKMCQTTTSDQNLEDTSPWDSVTGGKPIPARIPKVLHVACSNSPLDLKLSCVQTTSADNDAYKKTSVCSGALSELTTWIDLPVDAGAYLISEMPAL